MFRLLNSASVTMTEKQNPLELVDDVEADTAPVTIPPNDAAKIARAQWASCRAFDTSLHTDRLCEEDIYSRTIAKFLAIPLISASNDGWIIVVIRLDCT